MFVDPNSLTMEDLVELATKIMQPNGDHVVVIGLVNKDQFSDDQSGQLEVGNVFNIFTKQPHISQQSIASMCSANTAEMLNSYAELATEGKYSEAALILANRNPETGKSDSITMATTSFDSCNPILIIGGLDTLKSTIQNDYYGNYDDEYYDED